MRNLALIPAAALALITATTSLVDAGASSSISFSCTFNADGSARCSGSLRAARLSAGSSDFISVGFGNGPEIHVYAAFNGRAANCSSLNYPLPYANAFFIDYNSTIDVRFNANGTCGTMSFGNSSIHQSLGRP